MIPGSGPGRGRSWWHHVTVLTLWHYAWGTLEPVGRRREGRTVAVIRRR